jgi:hypothetical protein
MLERPGARACAIADRLERQSDAGQNVDGRSELPAEDSDRVRFDVGA